MRAQFRRISSALPKFRWITKHWFPNPTTLDLDAILGAIRRHNVAHALQPYLIPISIETEILQRFGVAAISNLVKLEKRNRGLEVLIAKFVVERTRNAGSGNVANNQEYANCAQYHNARKNGDDDLRRTFAAPARLARKWWGLGHLTRTS
jgi:hypothetical protein